MRYEKLSRDEDEEEGSDSKRNNLKLEKIYTFLYIIRHVKGESREHRNKWQNFERHQAI
jgi:hypothetical protein